MIERLKYWLFQKGKGCHHCCIQCEYFDICRWDVMTGKTAEQEQTVELLAVEAARKTEMPGCCIEFTSMWSLRKGRGESMKNFRLDDESGHQEALFSWAGYNMGRMPELEYMHHVPNGGKRDRATAVALKRQGVKAGVPDIVLPAARAGYHGLYIELKAGKNTTTENQRRWLEYLRQQGYYTAVCYGWQKAAELIERYLLHTEELTKEQKTITLR